MAQCDVISTQPAPYKCTLSDELVRQAEDELNEKEKWRGRDIQALRDMVLAHRGIALL